MADGLKEEAIFLRYLWSFTVRDGDVRCPVVKEDNGGVLILANNPATTPNSKHIGIRHHFIRERIARKEFKAVYGPSELKHADFLTKPLLEEAFCVHRNFAMNL